MERHAAQRPSPGLRRQAIRLFLLAFCLVSVAAPARAADVGFAWAQSFGTSGQTTSTPVTAIDASGNIYLAGSFTGSTLTLGTTTLTRIGTADVFVAKLTSNGRVLWAKNFGGAGATAVSNRVAVDATGSPNVYVSGSFTTASLTTPTLTKIGERDLFAVKLDSAGTITWAKSFGGTGASAAAAGIAVDTASPANVYLGGVLSGAHLTTPSITKIGDADALAIKLDASGATAWAKNFGGSGSYAFANDIAVDRSTPAQVYVVGGFHYFVSGRTSAALSTPVLTRIGEIDGFALKLDSSGSIVWARNYGGTGTHTSLSSVTVDRETAPNIYAAGYFHTGNLTTPSLLRLGTSDGLLLKLDSNGLTSWSKSIGGSGASTSMASVAVDTASPASIYVGGAFGSGTLNVPPLTRIGTNDGFAAKFDSSGTAVWATGIAGANAYNNAGFVSVDSSRPTGVVYAGELLSGNLTSPAITKAGSSDVVLAKLGTPESGWYWNSNQSGRGYSIEIDNGRLFFAAYGYTSDGSSIWYTSTGAMTSDTAYSGSVEAFQNGQTLTGTYQAPTALGSIGTMTLTFSSPTVAILTLPGASPITITRYEITSGGVTRGPAAGHPTKGWWWNPNESGRGFFIEVQDTTMFVSGFLYNSAGQATWYVANATMSVPNVFIGVLTEFAGGGSFTSSPFTAPTTSTSRGLFTIQFDSQTTGTMTLSTGTQVPLRRFSF